MGGSERQEDAQDRCECLHGMDLFGCRRDWFRGRLTIDRIPGVEGSLFFSLPSRRRLASGYAGTCPGVAADGPLGRLP